MNFRSRLRSVVVAPVAVAVVLVAGACGGGDKNYEEGTPAATGEAPDCSIVPLDVVRASLKREDLQGPAQGSRADGITCTFSTPGSGLADLNQVQLYNHVTEDSFAVIRDGFKRNNNKVNTIKGWGDEAWASTVQFYSPTNYFGVRKGKVAVLITSTSDYEHIRDLMKKILAKL
ncbi:MAG: hypothetical protein AB1679_27735 [Actinomycetota bacterium]